MTLLALAVALVAAPAAAPLERSFWLHASLGDLTQRGYWGPDFPATAPPSDEEIERAAHLLTTDYGANRLYLVYHHELPLADARRMLQAWRRACPAETELVPTFVLRMYDQPMTPVFGADELRDLAEFCREAINPRRVGLYDVYPNRDQGAGPALLEELFPDGLIRVGQQPGEPLGRPFTQAVQDTWSGFCHGTTADDWLSPGFGAATLDGWVDERNTGRLPVAWDLIVVAWDYTATARGGYPGYDDAERNQPLPAGRNRLAVQRIRDRARREVLAGFSSDLCIVQANSRATAHDGPEGAFYACLRRGERYQGYYRAPLDEIAGVYRSLASTTPP